ncbi:MAG: hypothetical protein ABWZ77_04930 [Naasia sp.]
MPPATRRPSAPARRRTAAGSGARRRPARKRPSAARRRSSGPRRPFLIAFGLGVLALVVAVAVAVTGAAQSTGGLVCVDAAGRPVEEGATIAGYGAEQLVNARAIIDAGVAAGAPRDAQIIAVMTAMGESGLRVLDRGDAVGPDSRGLFQQRDNGAWGTYGDRMDPTISASNFYRVLLRLPGWESLEPTVAAHRVQRNADERHYERYWPAAEEVVAALTIRSLQCGGDGLVPVPE